MGKFITVNSIFCEDSIFAKPQEMAKSLCRLLMYVYHAPVANFSCRKYSKTCVKRPLSKRPKIGFLDQLSFNAGQKNCRMLQGEHHAMLSTFIKLPFVTKIFVFSIFEWPFYTGFTLCLLRLCAKLKFSLREKLTLLHVKNKGAD